MQHFFKISRYIISYIIKIIDINVENISSDSYSVRMNGILFSQKRFTINVLLKRKSFSTPQQFSVLIGLQNEERKLRYSILDYLRMHVSAGAICTFYLYSFATVFHID